MTKTKKEIFMKKKTLFFSILFMGCISLFASGWCSSHGDYSGSSCQKCNDNSKKEWKETFDNAAAVGEAAGVITGYAQKADDFDEFADNVRTHEFESELLQGAQETGKAIGDAIADIYIWATSE